MKKLILADSDHDELVITKSVIGTMENIDIVGDTTSYSLLPSMMERHRPNYVLLAMRYDVAETVEAIGTIAERSNPCHVIVLSDQPDANDVLQCFRAGASEFISTPLDTEELSEIFSRLEQKQMSAQPAPKQEANGKVVAVCGVRGGSGATTVAVNLADQLSLQAKTALVDFHFGQGDLCVFLNITPNITLADIQQTSEPLDEALIESATIKKSETLQLLLQRPDNADQRWHVDDLEKLLNTLRHQYEYVVIDCGTDLQFLQGLQEQIYLCLLVMKQDISSLSLARVKLDQLKQLQMENENVSLLINAFSKTNVITHTRIAKVLKQVEFDSIREDEKKALSAMNRGIPLREVSRWGGALRDIRKLAERITGKPIPKETVKETVVQDTVELKPLAVLNQTAEPAM